jgi:oligopeptide/dipeptide ABC transporter ATP-binding protein
MPDQPLLKIEDLHVSFATGEKGLVRAVNGVNLSIFPGQTVAVVGESGSGKSVSALSTLQLIPTPPGRYDQGRILFQGQDLLKFGEREMRRIRGREIAMIFQEPMTSLNPVYTIGDQILEAILLHQQVTRRQAIEIATQALRDVGIADPERRLNEYPHQMSGGMRQRVMIAMALSCRPKLLIADEPTTALDVTIQAQILELLRKLQREQGMSIMLITHDLGVVAENADVVAVMYAGRVVEYATVEELFDSPQHPYTEGLFRSIPKLGADVERLETIPGAVPNPARLPSGCKFHPRCHRTREVAGRTAAGDGQAGDVVTIGSRDETAQVMGVCVRDDPALREVQGRHWAACHFVEGYAEAPKTTPSLEHRRKVVAGETEAPDLLAAAKEEYVK